MCIVGSSGLWSRRARKLLRFSQLESSVTGEARSLIPNITQAMNNDGPVASQADFASRAGSTPARVVQIMELRLLCPMQGRVILTTEVSVSDRFRRL